MSGAAGLLATHSPREYPDYQRLTNLLQALAAVYPERCTLSALGRSPEGREIWLLTLTDRRTGPAVEKPAALIEANIHAGEVTGSACALWTAHRLLAAAGAGDAAAAALLAERTLYIIPRISVDGAELYLKTPGWLRSVPRPWPWPEDPPGWYPEDLDGDGRILLTRVPDPEGGEWRVHPTEKRLLIRRRPGDGKGPFYRVLTEGRWRGAGATAASPPLPGAPVRPWGLDLNRNWPAHWAPEGEQPGAGPYPFSEPETRAVAAFVAAHPQIGLYLALHTTGGVILHPPAVPAPGGGGDGPLPPADAAAYGRLVAWGQEITGYHARSTYDAFAVAGEPLVKGADDWAYEHLGLLALTIELWNPMGRAGARSYGAVGSQRLAARSAEEWAADQMRLLRWGDTALGAQRFVDWRPFRHPQLGPVEVGGWDLKWALQNPPPHLLPDEIGPVAAFLWAAVAATPRLAVEEVTVEPLGGGCHRIVAAVENRGWLPSHVTAQALTLRSAAPVTAELTLPPAVRLLTGRARQELGHLDGYGVDSAGPSASRRRAEWVVRGPAGALLTCIARGGRAGVARAACTLS